MHTEFRYELKINIISKGKEFGCNNLVINCCARRFSCELFTRENPHTCAVLQITQNIISYYCNNTNFDKYKIIHGDNSRRTSHNSPAKSDGFHKSLVFFHKFLLARIRAHCQWNRSSFVVYLLIFSFN